MKQVHIVIQNPTGLHARPAKVFVNLAKQHQCDVRILHGDKKANAKSLISLLTLGVEQGSQITLEVDGVNETEALLELEKAITSGLGEEELIKKVSSEKSDAEKEEPSEESFPATDILPINVLKGIPAAPGIAIGPIYQLKREELEIKETFESESQEKDNLQKAIEKASGQLRKLSQHMSKQIDSKEAAIFDVHLEILDDADLLDTVLEKINTQQNAAQAWQSTIDERAQVIASLKDPLLAARAADLYDVGYRVLRILVGADDQTIKFPDYPVIVTAYDLSPSDTASMDGDRVLGLCTAAGGPTSHTAIIARALGLPSVVSIGERMLHQKDQTIVILDGDAGTVLIDPDKEAVSSAKQRQETWQKHLLKAQESASEPAITQDGHRVEVAANIGGVQDAEQAVRLGAEAVGLLRTEFLFLEREVPPTEEEQFEVYSAIAKAMQGRATIVRTLDVGGDKPLPYIELPAEENPFLGVRGIRLCLRQPNLLSQQIRAILRAVEYGPLRIMFPMVADISEWHAARKVVEETRQELGAPKVEMGIMIEIPSAALMADVFAPEVDFFSVGTNDLTQYCMAMDRMHPTLAGISDGLHPAVLRLIKTTIEAAHQAGKWVGICGELGADPQAVPVLVGLGIDELSVTVPAVPTVKAQIRTLSLSETQSLADKALACATALEVRNLVEEQIKK